MALRDGDVPLFFYELHESDTDLFADVLLAHETEYDEAEFLELVLESRRGSSTASAEDSLIEAIAADLAERAGFLVIDDSQLRVAVNVSARTTARSSRTIEHDEPSRRRSAPDFRTLLVDVEPDDAVWGDDRAD